MTNEEIKDAVYAIANAYMAAAKLKPTPQEQALLKSVVDLGVNFLQNINDMARK